MMLKGVFFLFGIFALAAGETYLVEDQFGSEYLMVPMPLQRQRRQTSVDINKNPGGTQVTLGHKGTIFENDKHLVSGGGFVSKQFRPTGPTTLGGGLGYEHKPSGSGINLGASNTRGFGTDFSATGNANLWRSNNGNTRLDAYANYGRHYGGPWGTGRPNYGGGLQFSHRF
ncbi:attacin-B-like [Harmonia axyridis]|uniref:attacin-B-like n=1 Tax=Harmonia axyridis TaxID=115357 RepID=UPI001E277A38|nr:attacin-B-like [Harmonia axyridis]